MPGSETTSWGLIEAAAGGAADALAEFASRYQPFVRDVLGARWRGSPLLVDLDDAVQDVFVACFQQGGGLQRADGSRGSRFRAYVAGIVRNVALRYETSRSFRLRHQGTPLDESGLAGIDTISQQLDRAWIQMVLRRAGDRFKAECAQSGSTGQRHWEVLRLRFEEGLPIRRIAAQLGEPAERVHQEYRRARQRFRTCLEAELALHCDSTEDLRRLWREFLDLL